MSEDICEEVQWKIICMVPTMIWLVDVENKKHGLVVTIDHDLEVTLAWLIVLTIVSFHFDISKGNFNNGGKKLHCKQSYTVISGYPEGWCPFITWEKYIETYNAGQEEIKAVQLEKLL